MEQQKTDESPLAQRPQLSAELEALERECDNLRWKLAVSDRTITEAAQRFLKMRTAGDALGNVAYNLAQRPGHTLTSDDVALLDMLRRGWDAVVSSNGKHFTSWMAMHAQAKITVRIDYRDGTHQTTEIDHRGQLPKPMTPYADLCGGPSGPSERAPG